MFNFKIENDNDIYGITNQPLLFAKQGKRRKINRVPRKQIFILYQNHKKTVIRFRNSFNFSSQSEEINVNSDEERQMVAIKQADLINVSLSYAR